MYRDSYQHGMLTVFYSVGSKPLAIWETHIQDGNITRFLDDDIKSMVLEIRGTNVSTTYMICPKGKQVLGIHMPFMVMIVKNLKKYFSFEVTILDDTKTRRRFRVSNFQSTSQVFPLSTAMPIGLNDGWNQIQFDLGKFTQRAYQRQFVEVQKLKINANIRLRRIYFAQRLVPDDELPSEYKLYFPLASKGGKGRKSIEKAKIGEETEVKPLPIEEKREGSKTVVEKTASKTLQNSIRRPSQEKEPDADAVSGSKLPVEGTEAIEGVPALSEVPAEGEVSADVTEGVAPEEGKTPSATKVLSTGAIAQPEEAPAESANAEAETVATESAEAASSAVENPPLEAVPPQEETSAEAPEATETSQEAPTEANEPPPAEAIEA